MAAVSIMARLSPFSLPISLRSRTVGENRRRSNRRRQIRSSEQAAGAKRHADRFDECKRLSRLNENIGKSDQEIWDMVA
jgi:hypothetical protein